MAFYGQVNKIEKQGHFEGLNVKGGMMNDRVNTNNKYYISIPVLIVVLTFIILFSGVFVSVIQTKADKIELKRVEEQSINRYENLQIEIRSGRKYMERQFKEIRTKQDNMMKEIIGK